MKLVFHTNTLLLLIVIALFFYVNSRHNRAQLVQVLNQDLGQDKDKDYDRKIIEEPKRFYDSRFVTRKQMAINVPTRGEAPEYQQVGYLGGIDDPENIKPLYGRQTYRGSGQWNYFTSLDSHLATKIPITIGDQECTDERGCKELYKNDAVDVNGTNYKANIYQTHAPRYIPY
jgi:hypothetical protein